ncbi:DUF4351 domain-containing protein [Cyanobium sp. BA20m-p-22]|uniref:DUF4351 domain-containing protein n=1 Tax=Cyanobium sp. BA20m-p-22 TaxID=2823704 RepID=UPI0020CBDA39|nr:DUF4351 domain-containing protein [Cyanobium sp. BA20m-p-22]MCP9910867.1 DUF4351 domain-containing protein [Cyanobium sp. BA20m-p-22]
MSDSGVVIRVERLDKKYSLHHEQGEPTTAQIQALPVEKLEALADALLDFQGPANLAAWLAANA